MSEDSISGEGFCAAFHALSDVSGVTTTFTDETGNADTFSDVSGNQKDFTDEGCN